MEELNSETEPGPQSRVRGVICAIILLALFALIYCVGFFGGRAIKDRLSSAAICTRGYSGAPCKPRPEHLAKNR